MYGPALRDSGERLYNIQLLLNWFEDFKEIESRPLVIWPWNLNYPPELKMTVLLEYFEYNCMFY